MAKRRRSYHDHADDEDTQIGMYRALRRIVELLEDLREQHHQAARVVLTPRNTHVSDVPIPPPPAPLPVPSFPPAPLNFEQRFQSMNRQDLLSIIYTMRQNEAGGNQPS